MTHDTGEVEGIVEDFNRRYYNQEFSYPDGEFNFTFVTDHLRTTLHHQLQKAREEEREAFCTILEKLYRAGDDRKQMTWEYLMRIRSKKAIKTPDQSELDQDVSK